MYMMMRSVVFDTMESDHMSLISMKNAIEQYDKNICFILQDIDETIVRCQELMAQLIEKAKLMTSHTKRIDISMEVR